MKKLFLLFLSSVIAVMSIGCMKKTFPFHQEVAEITSVEIVEAQSSKEFTVKCSVSSDEIDDFIVKLQKIKFGKSIGDPISIHGNAIKITYANDDYEIITHFASEYVENDVAYLLFVYCDEEEFNDLISKYLD